MTQTYKVQVSMNQAHIVESGFVWKQGDFGFNIEIEVLNFDITGATPQIIFRKASGAVESTSVTRSGNKFTYTLRGTELDIPGPGICDLKLRNSSTQRISTASFKYYVAADTMNGLNEESSSYSDTVAKIVGEIENEVVDLNTKKINKPVLNPNGSNGQLLRTLGNGQTEWTNVGLPTDEQTAQAVSEWLDNHPEATTTVEDGSITPIKLVESLKNKVIPLTKNEIINPIYIGDFLSDFSYVPSSVVKVGNYFYLFDPHSASYNQEHNQDYGNVRIFDIVNNVELVNDTKACRLGHANSACYNPDESIFYVSPSDIYQNNTIIPIKKLYKYTNQFDNMVEEDTPTYPKGVTFDPITHTMYYCDRDNKIYKKVSGEWVYFANIDLTNVKENILFPYRSYNQDFAVYNDMFYLSSPYGSILCGELKETLCVPLKHYSVSNEDNANVYRIGELEGFEFDADGHLYAAQFTTLTGFVRNGFITELPITDSFASSSAEESLFTEHTGTLSLSESSQEKFALDRGEVRSLNQLKTITTGFTRILINSGNDVVEPYPVIINSSVEVAIRGYLSVPYFNVWEKLVITGLGVSNRLICTGTSSLFRLDRNGDLSLQGGTLNIDMGNVPEGEANLISVGDCAGFTNITCVLNSVNGTTLYLADRYALQGNSTFRATPLRFHNNPRLEIEGGTIFSGYISGSAKDIAFAITFPFEFSSALVASITQGKITVRGINGYLPDSNGISLTDQNYTVTVGIRRFQLIIIVHRDTAFSVTNNTPVNVIVSSTIKFSFVPA